MNWNDDDDQLADDAATADDDDVDVVVVVIVVSLYASTQNRIRLLLPFLSLTIPWRRYVSPGSIAWRVCSLFHLVVVYIMMSICSDAAHGVTLLPTFGILIITCAESSILSLTFKLVA